jgi:hypothetical protein
MVATPGPVLAQSTYCDRLRIELASLERSSAAGRSQPFADAVRRQRSELERTIAYARSIGCQRQRFIIFGEPAPAECGALEQQINRMEAGIAQLDSQAQRSGGVGLDAKRNAILAALDANCRNVAAGLALRRQPGLVEQLFGGAPGSDEVPVMPEDEPPPPGDDWMGPVGSGKTLCVRRCDGYYFPISPNADRGRFEADASLCQASCPNADVELFVQRSGSDVANAMSLSGDSYSSLPNAFRYRTNYDPSCSCKRPGQSWVEALAGAERLLGDKRPTDVTVTEQQSLEMSRPREPAKPVPPNQRTSTKPAPGLKPGIAPPAGAPAGPLGTTQSSKPALRQSENATSGRGDVRVVAPTLAPERSVRP